METVRKGQIGGCKVEIGDKFKVDGITPLTQGVSTLCWATSYAMMLQYKGRMNTPEAIKGLLAPLKANAAFYKGLQDYAAANADMKPPVDPDAERDVWTYGYSHGLMPEQFVGVGVTLGLTSYRSTFLSDPDHLLWIMQHHGPIWCAGHFLEPDGLHAVVAVGIEKMKMGTFVTVYDPYGTWNPKRQSSDYQKSYADFYNQLLGSRFSMQVWP